MGEPVRGVGRGQRGGGTECAAWVQVTLRMGAAPLMPTTPLQNVDTRAAIREPFAAWECRALTTYHLKCFAHRHSLAAFVPLAIDFSAHGVLSLLL